MAPNQNSEKLQELKSRFELSKSTQARHDIFREMVVLLSPLLLGVARRCCGGCEDTARDLVQDFLLTLYSELKKKTPIIHMESWCATCITRRALDFQRNARTVQKNLEQLRQASVESEPAKDTNSIIQEAIHQAHDAINNAEPQKAEEILLLAFRQGGPIEDDGLKSEFWSTALDAIVMMERARLTPYEQLVVDKSLQGIKPGEIARQLNAEVKKKVYPVLEKFRNRVWRRMRNFPSFQEQQEEANHNR